jgi:acyl carrier protein
MDRVEFLNQLHVLFEAEPGSIAPNCSIDGVPGWDSLTFLGLIAMLDEQYGVSLGPKEILACDTVEQLMQLVDRQSIARAA